ncbi:hypothetical protein AB4525_07940 [Vibrio breoganii]
MKKLIVVTLALLASTSASASEVLNPEVKLAVLAHKCMTVAPQKYKADLFILASSQGVALREGMGDEAFRANFYTYLAAVESDFENYTSEDRKARCIPVVMEAKRLN